MLHIFDPLKVVQCKDCGLIFLSPRLKENVAKKIYENASYYSQGQVTGYEGYLFQEKALRITFRRFLGEMKKRGMASGSKLLEVGSGLGYLLDEARRFFPERTGMELSAEAASHAHLISGAEVHVGEVSALPIDVKDFDVIVALNVIEHVYSPLEFLSSLKQRLKSGGRIVIATPDIGSFWHDIMGRKWPSFKIPEHVIFYTHRTLALLLDRAKFGDIRDIPFPHAFPLGLIGSKLRIPIPGKFGEIPVWIPKTMVALSGEKRGE
jgi:2-polyprenyl-3-methyl-5-hydroxy-6-metoxy-1,4-benzoquinol methylase